MAQTDRRTTGFWFFTAGNTGDAPFEYGFMDAGETFRAGELVFRNNDGEIEEFPQDGTVAAIADMDSGRIGGVAAFGPGDTTLNWRTGAAWATGDLIGFVPWDRQGVSFITDNIQSAVGTNVVPRGDYVGEAFQVAYDNVTLNQWVIDAGNAATLGTHVAAVVTEVRDSQGRPISATDTTTGVWVVFKLLTR